MLERTRRYGERYRGRGKRNGGKQGRRVEKRREGDFLKRTSIRARFCYPRECVRHVTSHSRLATNKPRFSSHWSAGAS